MESMDGVVHHPTSKALKFALCIIFTMSKVLIGTINKDGFGDKSEALFFVFKLFVPFLLSDTSGGSPFYRLEWAAHQHFPF